MPSRDGRDAFRPASQLSAITTTKPDDRRVLCPCGHSCKILDRHRFFSYLCTRRMDAVSRGPLAGGNDAVDLLVRIVDPGPIIDGEARGDLSMA